MKTQPKLLQETITMPVGRVYLSGDLAVPTDSKSLVIFVHGSGSSRFSPRNRYVAQTLNDAGCATLLFDLLTPEEEDIDNTTRMLRFNIDLLSSRVLQATTWLQDYANTSELNIGYFGASTGAAAALIAAAELPGVVKAVVSRGGRPDLAGSALYHVSAPTLLIVGGLDTVVLELNEEAAKVMPCLKKVEVVQGATHLFEEAGKLEVVSKLARDWFTKYLS